MTCESDRPDAAANISKSCCFTGHRALTEMENDIESRLVAALETLINEKGVDCFYAGGALGFDMLASMCVLRLRSRYPHLKLCLALPCKNQWEKWGAVEQMLYDDILGAADSVYYASETYNSACMRLRNDYMLEHCLYCVAFLRRTSGGTYYTVSRARRLGKELILL